MRRELLAALAIAVSGCASEPVRERAPIVLEQRVEAHDPLHGLDLSRNIG